MERQRIDKVARERAAGDKSEAGAETEGVGKGGRVSNKPQ